MDSILDKLSQLPMSAKQKMSSPDFISVFNDLDKKYRIKAASVFLEYAFGFIAKKDLPLFLQNKLGFGGLAVKEIVDKFDFLLGQMPELSLSKSEKADDQNVVIEAETQNLTNFISDPQKNIARNLSFDAEDEQEIAKIKNNSVKPSEDYNYDALYDIIIKEFAYQGDDVLAKRLKNIIILNLRDVRDEIETLDALTKSRKIGGMELDSNSANSLIGIVKNKQNEKGNFVKTEIKVTPLVTKTVLPKAILSPSNNKPQQVVKEPQKITLAQKIQDEKKGEPTSFTVVEQPKETAVVEAPKSSQKALSKKVFYAPPMKIEEEDGLPVIKMDSIKEEVAVKPKENFEKINKPQEEIDKIIKEAELKTDNDPKIEKTEKKEVKEEILPQASPVHYPTTQKIPPRIIEAQNTRRPLLDGVRIAKKLTGPIEELSQMTLIEFRRLAETPDKATSEITKKVQLLEDESYERKMEGVNAWFKNEINRFYRLLGLMAMEENRNINEVIKERLVSGKPTLSIEEFDAVMKLNNQLRH